MTDLGSRLDRGSLSYEQLRSGLPSQRSNLARSSYVEVGRFSSVVTKL